MHFILLHVNSVRRKSKHRRENRFSSRSVHFTENRDSIKNFVSYFVYSLSLASVSEIEKCIKTGTKHLSLILPGQKPEFEKAFQSVLEFLKPKLESALKENEFVFHQKVKWKQKYLKYVILNGQTCQRNFQLIIDNACNFEI